MDAVKKSLCLGFYLLWLSLATSAVASIKISPGFVGSKACAACHTKQYQDWLSSQHSTALESASEKTVKGNFNNSQFEYNGVVSHFFKDGEQFLVKTDGPDGKPGRYQIKYTIGDYPLQQYLIESPGGRLQTLGIGWDTRPEASGGQRWFHLYPDQPVDFKSPFHWTAPQQNANLNCIECHTTNYRKNYNEQTKTYSSEWNENGAGCESCHGPASQHLDWAANVPGQYRHKGFRVDLADKNRWHFPKGEKIARPLTAHKQQQVETCSACHSRRQQITATPDVSKPLTDNYLPALLRSALYEDDGQIREEVFVYGSFKQSRMFQAGVTCSNCHNPHSGQLKAPANQVCAQCHLPSEYDTPKHTFHPQQSAGSQCVDCHMPAKTYMVVDPRRDHSFKTPRPDISELTGSPNTCTQCHSDKNNHWAATAMDQWLGSSWRNKPEFASAFHAAGTGQAGVGRKLAAVINDDHFAAIIRASALDRMVPYLTSEHLPTLRKSLKDPDPLVRIGALSALESLPAQYKPELLAPLLNDSSRAVRQLVGLHLADVPEHQLPETYRPLRQSAIIDYIDAQKLSSDRAVARINLGNLYRKLNQYDRAEAELLEAIRLEPYVVPAYVNLADLYRRQGRLKKEQEALDQGLAEVPGSADLSHARGLYQIRQKRYRLSLDDLRTAAENAPDNARFVYVYAVALHTVGEADKALMLLQKAAERFPGNREIEAAIRAYKGNLAK